MSQTAFAIIGAGWRSEFYLRIAHALPDRFRVSGMVVRDAAKAAKVEEKWDVKTHRTLGALMEGAAPDFAVVCVAQAANAAVLREVADRDVPALVETPPAGDLADLLSLHELTERGAKVQVAEQYIFQPMHAARLAVVASGRLGKVTQAQVSAAHGYHGLSLIRHYLGVGFDECTIVGRRFASPIIAGPGRDGPPTEEKTKMSAQTLAWLEFGDKLGVFDFTGDQYFSWVRSPRVLVRGERGEINNGTVRYLQDFRTPVEFDLRRCDAGEDGNLEGYYHKGILAAGEWVYENPFVPARLSDDEIAIATSMDKMAHYVQGGPSFYTLAQASQDRYLDLMIEQAIKTGNPVAATRQPWASDG